MKDINETGTKLSCVKQFMLGYRVRGCPLQRGTLLLELLFSYRLYYNPFHP